MLATAIPLLIKPTKDTVGGLLVIKDNFWFANDSYFYDKKTNQGVRCPGNFLMICYKHKLRLVTSFVSSSEPKEMGVVTFVFAMRDPREVIEDY